MKVKLRTLIFILTIATLLIQLLNVLTHKGINTVAIVLAGAGLAYLVITADEFTRKQSKENGRKILQDNGEFVEEPEFRKMFYEFTGEYIKKYNAIRNELNYRRIRLFCAILFVIGIVVSIYKLLFINYSKVGVDLVLIVFGLFICSMLLTIGLVVYIIKDSIIVKRIKNEFDSYIYDSFLKKINPTFSYFHKSPNLVELKNELSNCFRSAKVHEVETSGIVDGTIESDMPIKIVDINKMHAYEFKEGTMNLEDVFEYKGTVSYAETIIDTRGLLKVTRSRDVLKESEKATKVLLDNTEFETLYNVFSPDKIFAMRILTPDVMDILVEFAKYSIEFDLIIKNDRVLIKFYEDNIFDFSFVQNKFDRDNMFLIYCITNFSTKLTNEINKILREFIA